MLTSQARVYAFFDAGFQACVSSVIEDFGSPILDRAQDAEQPPAGDAAPGTILQPRLAFQGLLAFDVALAQGAYGEASTLRFAPPARAGQGKAPEDRFVLIEQNNFATAGAVLQGSEFERARGELSRGRIQAPGGPMIAYIFFLTHRAHFHDRAGLRSGGPIPSPVHGSSTEKRGHHAGGGLDRQGD
jgi:hypothetical protein